MKNKLLCLITALMCAVTAQAQWAVLDFSNLTQGIINSSNEMVQTSTSAQTLLQNFRETEKIFQQGKQYYDKLRAVNDLVRSARKVQQCILMVGEISEEYVANYPKMLSDNNFTSQELSAIATGYTQLLQRSTNSLKDLQSVINPSTLSMTDKDRLDVVENSYKELSHLRNLTSYYTRKMQTVSRLRAREKNEKQRSLSLYGSDEQKYP